MPITPITGALFHADTQFEAVLWVWIERQSKKRSIDESACEKDNKHTVH